MQDFSDQTFTYSGTKYTFKASLLSNESPSFQHALKNQNVLRFEYVNAFNSLYLEGKIVYKDDHAVVDKYLNKQYAYCSVYFVVNDQKTDGEMTVETLSKTEVFSHQFLINGIKILERVGHSVTYSISLISSNWLNCIASFNYSNYGSAPESVTDIIRKAIAGCKLGVNSRSFDDSRSQVKIDYITNGNDNVITASKYLLDKMYYYSSRDAALKAIVYNEFSNTYQLFDLGNKNTCTGVSTIIVSMFKSNSESQTQQEPNNLNSVTKFPRTNTIVSLFSKDCYSYSLSTNQFGNSKIKTESLVGFSNNQPGFDQASAKYMTLSSDNMQYLQRGSFWNNDYAAYDSSFRIFSEDSAMTVETVGDMRRKPGYYVDITVDRDSKYVVEDDIQSAKEIKNKYKTFEGIWVCGKVRHFIFPSELESPVKRYRQNLVLFRNFQRLDSDE